MKIDLNDKKFVEGDTVIFNNGKGGLATKVSMTVSKKEIDAPEGYPDYNLIFTQEDGGQLRQGFYYPTKKEGEGEKDFEKRAIRFNKRLIKILFTALGGAVALPDGETYTETTNKLMAAIAKAVEGKLFNVYVTFGNNGYVSKYLDLRYFDFIELYKEGETSSLFPKNGEILQRPVPTDSLKDLTFTGEEASPSKKTEDDWIF